VTTMPQSVLALFMTFVCLCSTLSAQTTSPNQDIAGSWQGAFVFGQGKVRSILYVAPRGEAGYTGLLIDLESEDELLFPGASDTGPINFADGKIAFEIKSVEMHFEGTVSPSGNEIKGKFTEGEISGDVIFTREAASSASIAEEYTSQEYMILMRDGIHLHTTVFSPKNRTEALPFLIERSPYGLGLDQATWHINLGYADLARDGYFFVFQDIRGRYQSEGQYVNHRPVRSSRGTASKEIDEGSDTYDTIEWLVKNVPGNNGKAGILGISYGGWLAEMALVEPHPALKAASEQASAADWFLGDDFHHNGAFRLSYGFEHVAELETGKTNKPFQFQQYDTYDWYLKLGPLREVNARFFQGEKPTWNNFVAHPNYDDFWKRMAVQRIVVSVKVPNLNVGGWFDQEDFAGPWRIFAASEVPESRQSNYMVEGPWNHGGWFSGPGRRLKNLDFASNTGEYFRQRIQARWFHHWLKDDPDTKLGIPRIQLFETGSNQWRAYDQWPPSGAQPRRLYLHAGGEASFDPPQASAPAFDTFVSDPHKPVPYRERPIPDKYSNPSGWSTWQTDDQRFAETRPDVAVWKTKPLESDVRIAGNVIADLFASTSGTDSDWIVKLIDVYPNSVPDDPPMGGYELMIAADVLRGRFRNSFEKPEPVAPNQVAEYRIDLLSHDHVFRKGHRMMVQVQSTWFPVIDRNPQTFVPNIFEADEKDFRVATQRIFASKAEASAIVLPVLQDSEPTQ
jgi:uncharacterized protein